MPARANFLSPSRLVLLLVAASLVAAELIPSLFGLGNPPHRFLPRLALTQVMLASACLGSFLFYLFLLPRRKVEMALVVVVGVALDAWLSFHRISYLYPTGCLLALGMGLGLASLPATLLRALTPGPDRDRAVEVLALAVALPGLYIFSVFFHSVTATLNPMVYDHFAYAFDGLTGVQPSFLIAGPIEAFRPFRGLVSAVYFHLPVFMALAHIQTVLQPDRAISNPVLAFLLVGVLGGSLYDYFPAVGVKVLCGQAFPSGPWPAVPDPPRVIPAPLEFPRNCMPSMHLAWILTAHWALRGYAPTIRALGSMLVFLTFLSTFNVGCHYLIDLVVAVPFAVGIHALAMRWFPRLVGLRVGVFIFGATATLGWIALMRHRPFWALDNPALTLTALALTVLASLALEGRLARATLLAADRTSGTPASSPSSPP